MGSGRDGSCVSTHALGDAELNAFLSHLATQERMSTSTQNQDLAALLILYRTVLGKDVGNLEVVIRARKRKNLLLYLRWRKWVLCWANKDRLMCCRPAWWSLRNSTCTA